MKISKQIKRIITRNEIEIPCFEIYVMVLNRVKYSEKVSIVY